MGSSPSLTEQLQRFAAGDRSIAETVLREVLPRLRQIAAGHLQRERKVAPLSPTELIHEVWITNLHQGGWQIRDREHFYCVAAYAMRQVLVDQARHRLAGIRGNGVMALSLDQANKSLEPATGAQEHIVEIGIALDTLEKRDRLAARIVDLHYFAGFTLEETAAITGLTLRQLRHRWEKTRRWLQMRLSP